MVYVVTHLEAMGFNLIFDFSHKKSQISVMISSGVHVWTRYDHHNSAVSCAKLLHVYKSRRGFSKGAVLCGEY